MVENDGRGVPPGLEKPVKATDQTRTSHGFNEGTPVSSQRRAVTFRIIQLHL